MDASRLVHGKHQEWRKKIVQRLVDSYEEVELCDQLARWFKYFVMEALKRRDIRKISRPRGLERPPVVERQLKVYPDGV
jgi:hypothetical protein